jgi:hypothetical protein
MDVQFSGAVDFAPLFNGMNQTKALQSHKASHGHRAGRMGGNHQAKMEEEQNQIMSEINAGTQASIMNHFAANGIGQNVNIIA